MTKVLINAIHTKTGGGVVYLNNILPILAKEDDLEITVLCHQNYSDVLEIPGNVDVHQVHFKGGFFITLLWEQFVLPFIAKELKSEVTLNIANFAPIFAPKPVILLTNNPEVRFYTNSITQKLYWWALIVMTKVSLFVCPKVLSNGKYLQDVYAGGILKPLQRKINNAPSACTFKAGPSKGRIKGQVLAVGDFYVHKDYPTLLKAFAEVKKHVTDATLVIVGREVDVYTTEKIKQLVKLLKLTDDVTFTGPIPHKDICELYATSELYVSPSKAEAFSLTLLEAMTMGLPSVVADYPFQHEVAEDNAALYVPVYKGRDADRKTVQAMAGIMLRVLQDESVAEFISRKGKEMAIKFNWKDTGKTVARTLREAVGAD